jgi:hypothetical protein
VLDAGEEVERIFKPRQDISENVVAGVLPSAAGQEVSQQGWEREPADLGEWLI